MLTPSNPRAKRLLELAHKFELEAARVEALLPETSKRVYANRVDYIKQQRDEAAKLRAEAQQIERGGLRDA